MLKLHELEPDLLLVNRLRGYCEILLPDEVGLLLIVEVRVSLQEFFEPVLFWLKFAVLVFEHADGSARVDDEHLSDYIAAYLSVVWAETGLAVACGHLYLLVELKFSQDLLVLLLLVFPLSRHLLIIKSKSSKSKLK